MCAIVKGPLHSEMASGNLGAVCYSRWKGRAVARNVWTGTDPNTASQQARRAILSDLAYAWGNDLTEIQRGYWNDLARSLRFPDRFGEMKPISGYLLFLKRNLQRRPPYVYLLASPTEGGEKFWVDVLELTYETAGPRVWVRPRYGDAANNQTYYDYWRSGPFQTEARNPTDAEWSHKAYKIPLSSWYDYGITQGYWYWYRVRGGWSSGIVSPWFQNKIFIPT